MNTDHINEVADAIETAKLAEQDIGFNMSYYRQARIPGIDAEDHTGHNCGTVACIAGWTKLLKRSSAAGAESFSFAQDYFELDDELSIQLFLGENYIGPEGVGDLVSITDKRAVAVLRHLAKTGEVDWNIVVPGEPDYTNPTQESA